MLRKKKTRTKPKSKRRAEEKKNPQAVIYARYSPQRRDQALIDSQARQEEACRAYCAENGLDVEAVFVEPMTSGRLELDDVSSAAEVLRNRPQLAACIASLTNGRTLVVESLDRLCRTYSLIPYLESLVEVRGCKIVYVKEPLLNTPEGADEIQKIVFGVLKMVVAAMKEVERTQIGQRTSEAMLSQQRRGKMISSKPIFGQRRHPRIKSRMINNHEEMEVVHKFLLWSGSGMTPAEICRKARVEKLPRRNGSHKWRRDMIERILRHYKRPKN